MSGIHKCSLFYHLPLRLRQKLVDPVNTRNRRLDRLDLHAEVLDRREYLGNIVDDCDRFSHGHAEQCQDLRVSGCRKQHDDRHRHRIQEQDQRRVNSVVKVRLLDRRIALPDIVIIPFLHIRLFSKCMDRSDTPDCLRNMICDTAHCRAVL